MIFLSVFRQKIFLPLIYMKNHKMRNRTNKNWGIEALKGLIALILSLIIFINPSDALIAIATYLGILSIIAGIVFIVISLSGKKGFWQLILAQGIIFALIGILIIAYPGGTASLLILFIALLITFLGILQLIAYMQLKEAIPASRLSLINAILSILIGGLLLFNPFEGALLATIIIGIYATWFGITRLYVAWKLFSGKS